MGTDVVSRVKRHRAAAFGLVLRDDRAKALLHVVRSVVYGQLVPMWPGAEPWRAGALPHSARRRRRRIATKRAGHPERYLFTREAWHGVCSVRNSGRRSSHHWPLAGRLDHGQFFLEMDFLHQRASGDHFAAVDLVAHQGSAVYETREPEERLSHRLHWHRADQPWPGQHADYFGQGA